ncbi:PAX3- and PAX7-binding protein 1 isoform X2 [Manduca sexta]|uniref:PAX3- and PAX7-binding protein 1 isoform X2 n=1 Tax=Manduca sexta TaxID=7130 RepID=UPI00189067BE|nr:PAX3- and PAX7-binding protein 1 isoform X2 [Manduca sexta]
MFSFRKPKRIQRRVACADDDEDAEPEAPPPPIISHEKKEKPVKTTSLLSFVDEEEEEEVFKVKKSSQSKRLAKRREKERRKVPDGDSNKYDNNINEDNSNHMDVDEEPPKPKKKVTLEGLILSGREALAADGAGDISEEEDDEEDRGFHRYRAESVRAALAVPGAIPDAALIHAARKTRQQARELGADFIPVPSEAPAGSRLVRDDDGSADEDDDEGRIHVRGLDLPSDKPKRGTAAASPDEEINSDVEEWEEQQMQKAMPAIVDISESAVELNPFATACAPVSLGAVTQPHLRPLAATPPNTAHDLVVALRQRLEELKMERNKTAEKREEVMTRLQQSARVRVSASERCSTLGAAYKRAQAARGYLTDLVECLDEKMPQLEALESRALAMHRRRCEFLVERRRADVRDQAQDVLAMGARAGSVKPVDTEEKVRRTAEREGRRRARRLKREAAAAASGAALHHRDGDSSDDELPPRELHHYRAEREAIAAEACALFADALGAWRSAAGVCARVARWRRRDPALYARAFLPAALPRLLAPYVRHQLILWNPLADEDNDDYEKMDWYKSLMMYGVRCEKAASGSSGSDSEEGEEDGPVVVTEDSVRDDVDLLLVPTIVNKVVLPKLVELVEHAWDPMCVRACVRLRQLLLRAATGAAGGGAGGAAALRVLATAVATRLAAAHNADVFLPALPPQSRGGGSWRSVLAPLRGRGRAAAARHAGPRRAARAAAG